jgi:hypothetical protein
MRKKSICQGVDWIGTIEHLFDSLKHFPLGPVAPAKILHYLFYKYM